MFNPEKDNKNIKSFDEISKDAKKVKDDSVAYIKSDAEDTIKTSKERAREAGKSISEFFRNNSKKLKIAEESASRTIKSNPLASAAVVFATGLVVGSALRRTKRITK
jgi:ElaB/YqjD/DUF883 family membrane-anchored ribosome-binding protein